MKKYFFLLLMISFSGFSQKPYNKLSFEFGSGYSKPLSNISNSGAGSFTSTNWNMGLRYMYNLNYGVKGAFNYDSFEENGFGTIHFRFNLDSYQNIGNVIDLSTISNRSVALYSHVGLGATFVKSRLRDLTVGYIPGWERQVDISLGLTPRFRLNDVFSFYADFTYIMAMKQHFNYSGEPILNAGITGINGAHTIFGIGLSIVIDNSNDDHADFY